MKNHWSRVLASRKRINKSFAIFDWRKSNFSPNACVFSPLDSVQLTFRFPGFSYEIFPCCENTFASTAWLPRVLNLLCRRTTYVLPSKLNRLTNSLFFLVVLLEWVSQLLEINFKGSINSSFVFRKSNSVIKEKRQLVFSLISIFEKSLWNVPWRGAKPEGH